MKSGVREKAIEHAKITFARSEEELESRAGFSNLDLVRGHLERGPRVFPSGCGGSGRFSSAGYEQKGLRGCAWPPCRCCAECGVDDPCACTPRYAWELEELQWVVLHCTCCPLQCWIEGPYPQGPGWVLNRYLDCPDGTHRVSYECFECWEDECGKGLPDVPPRPGGDADRTRGGSSLLDCLFWKLLQAGAEECSDLLDEIMKEGTAECRSLLAFCMSLCSAVFRGGDPQAAWECRDCLFNAMTLCSPSAIFLWQCLSAIAEALEDCLRNTG